jgi:hypothetical protein
MKLFDVSSFWYTTLAVTTIWILAILYRRITTYFRHRSFILQHRCQPPTYPHRDPIFGLGLLLLYKNAFEERMFQHPIDS